MKVNLKSLQKTQRSLERTVLLPISVNLKEMVLLMMNRKILPSGSTHGVLYGLPKVHKSGCPFRPIVSSVNTYNYNLASYLVRVLQPVQPISTNQFTVKDSFSFAEWAKTYNHNGEYMCSSDVSSLFTNVPLDETIQICLDTYLSLPENLFITLPATVCFRWSQEAFVTQWVPPWYYFL